MRLVPLTPDYPLTDFDCGDSDLNKFLLDDAKPAQVIGLPLRSSKNFVLPIRSLSKPMTDVLLLISVCSTTKSARTR